MHGKQYDPLLRKYLAMQSFDQLNQTYLQNRRYPTCCIERDRLTGCLLNEVKNKYSAVISVEFDTKCVGIQTHYLNTDNEYSSATIQNLQSNEMQQTEVNGRLVVGCDGSNSAVRDGLTSFLAEINCVQYPETNERVYRTLPIVFNNSKANDFCPAGQYLSYSLRSKVDLNLEALPTVEGIHLGVLLYRPNNTLMESIQTVDGARAMLDEHFPVASPGISDTALERFVTQRPSRFQPFSYVYPQLHYSGSVVLLGDSIHTVKPYFGLGVNSGLEDVLALNRAMDNSAVISGSSQPSITSRQTALAAFSESRAKEAKALVTLSERMDRNFFWNFIFPIILDADFAKLVKPIWPRLFERSIVSCLQDETYTFIAALQRKQRDRWIQYPLLAVMISSVLMSAYLLGRKILLPLGKLVLQKLLARKSLLVI